MKKLKVLLLTGILGLLLCFAFGSHVSNSEDVKIAPDNMKDSVLVETTSTKAAKTETLGPTPAQTPMPTSTPTPDVEEFLIWMGWAEFESGEDSWASTAGDGGHAYGRYQLDDRYDLAEFFRFCVNEDPNNFESFTTFYYVDSKSVAHIKNTELIPKEWSWICATVKEDFYEMQTRFAFEYYYENAKKTLRQSGVDIAGYSPVLQGTVMSLAIRDGFYKLNLSSLINTYYKGISEREWLSEVYAAETAKHPDQEMRWATRQKNAAMAALTAFDNKKLTKKVCEKHAFETIQLSK